MACHRTLRRNGGGVGEDAAKTGLLGFPRSVCGPCPDFLTTNAHTSERKFLIQQFSESSVMPHSALGPHLVQYSYQSETDHLLRILHGTRNRCHKSHRRE